MCRISNAGPATRSKCSRATRSGIVRGGAMRLSPVASPRKVVTSSAARTCAVDDLTIQLSRAAGLGRRLDTFQSTVVSGAPAWSIRARTRRASPPAAGWAGGVHQADSKIAEQSSCSLVVWSCASDVEITSRPGKRKRRRVDKVRAGLVIRAVRGLLLESGIWET